MAVPVEQAPLFATSAAQGDPRNSSVFLDNMRLPIHRWFRFSAGFSARWVTDLISGYSGKPRVLDPFAGSATTLLAAQATGVESIGVENHPFVARVAQAKLHWVSDPDELVARAERIVNAARPVHLQTPPDLMAKVFRPEALGQLYGLRDELARQCQGDALDEVLWLALVGILRACSPVGTAQWQYVLPRKTKARVAEPYPAFQDQVQRMAADMTAGQLAAVGPLPPARLVVGDARDPASVPEAWADLVITSPPYPNNYDYADATRLEMTFLGEVERWGDLQTAVRRHLVRSCSQHMAGYDAEPALEAAALAPIRDELTTAYLELEAIRLERGGRKAYHSMIVAYFSDLAACWATLRTWCRQGSTVRFVIGDSAPYGVYLPVERWLGELALGAGFSDYSFTKLRDRNTKWKNRKHRVPLHEGILLVEG
jgi:hypothetical protein